MTDLSPRHGDTDRHTHSAGSERAGQVIARSWPLLLSVGLLMVGAGLQSSLIGLRGPLAGFSTEVIGIVVASYYAGYVIGSSWVPRLIGQVGHIRAFTGLASLASVSMVLHGFVFEPVPWIALRLLSGVCLAGLFVVAESWLSASGTPGTRGTLLAVYMLVVTASLVAGQFLLRVADIAGPALFVLVSVVVSLAVVPMSLAPQRTPRPHQIESFGIRRLIAEAPLALFAGTAAGAGVGALLGFGAVEATALGFDIGGVALFVAAVPAGSALLQVPLGRWSDRTDRRRVIGAVAFVGAAAALGGALLSSSPSLGAYVAVAFVLGGSFFPLYSLALAHLTDFVEPEHVVGAGARMIMVNGIGAASAPVMIAPMVGRWGPGAFFAVLAVVLAGLGSFAMWRLTRRAAVPPGDQVEFAPVTPGMMVGTVEIEARRSVAAGSILGQLRKRG